MVQTRKKAKNSGIKPAEAAPSCKRRDSQAKASRRLSIDNGAVQAARLEVQGLDETDLAGEISMLRVTLKRVFSQTAQLTAVLAETEYFDDKSKVWHLLHLPETSGKDEPAGGEQDGKQPPERSDPAANPAADGVQAGAGKTRTRECGETPKEKQEQDIREKEVEALNKSLDTWILALDSLGKGATRLANLMRAHKSLKGGGLKEAEQAMENQIGEMKETGLLANEGGFSDGG